MVNEGELHDVVRMDLPQACEKLIELAKERGGPDNITVQLVRVN